MEKSCKIEFLKRGGVLLRKGTNRKGEYLIVMRQLGTQWQPCILFQTKEDRDFIFNKLVKKRPDKFRADESSVFE